MATMTAPKARAWVAAWVAVMIAVPAWGLLVQDRPAPFSWQMYAGTEHAETWTAHSGEDAEELATSDWLVRPRAEAWARDGLAEHVCRLDPTIDEVVMERRPLLSVDVEKRMWTCTR